MIRFAVIFCFLSCAASASAALSKFRYIPDNFIVINVHERAGTFRLSYIESAALIDLTSRNKTFNSDEAALLALKAKSPGAYAKFNRYYKRFKPAVEALDNEAKTFIQNVVVQYRKLKPGLKPLTFDTREKYMNYAEMMIKYVSLPAAAKEQLRGFNGLGNAIEAATTALNTGVSAAVMRLFSMQ